jgi:Flp pilus assembly protein TadG
VEFSLTVVFLSILLLSLLDLGRAYFTYLQLKDAAAEGAYFGSVYPQCVDINGINDDSAPACGDSNNIPYRVRNSAPRGGLVDWTDASAQITIELPCGTTNPCVMTAGQVLTVTVAYGYRLLTPIAGALSSSQSLTLTARSSAVIIRVPNCTSSPCH